MAPSSITTALAEESDARTLASIMTAAFSASDTAYHLIWDGAPEGTHDMMALKGLLSPVQKEGRITYKAVDEESGKLVGFASWMMPRKKIATGGGGGMPDLPGVNMELWGEKLDGPRKSAERDEDPEKDLSLFCCS